MKVAANRLTSSSQIAVALPQPCLFEPLEPVPTDQHVDVFCPPNEPMRRKRESPGNRVVDAKFIHSTCDLLGSLLERRFVHEVRSQPFKGCLEVRSELLR